MQVGFNGYKDSISWKSWNFGLELECMYAFKCH